MRAPRGLTATGKHAYIDAVRVLEQLGEDPELSRGAIERYASAVDELHILQRAWKHEGSPGTTLNSRGVTIAHPLPAVIAKAERSAADLADRLGLTPKARRSLRLSVGRPPGAASAPDRAVRRTLRAVPGHQG
jgi:P27 family predicted phage terminase small subunit